MNYMNQTFIRLFLILIMLLSQSYTVEKTVQPQVHEYYNHDTANLSLIDQKKLEEVNEAIAVANKKILEDKLENERMRLYTLIIVFLFVFMVVLFITYRYYIKQRLKESELRNKIASDLHDDIGATLSSISIFSEVALQKVKSNDQSAIDIVSKIGDTSRALLENINDIVWSINSGNDTIGALKDRILFTGKNLLHELDIDFRVFVGRMDEQVRLSMYQRKNIYLIFKESLNNCAKYSKATRVEVSLDFNNENITLKISDNGIGFDEKAVKRGNGLNNIKKRAAEIGGQLVIESGNQGGCIIRSSFPTGKKSKFQS
jgi:two-component system, NarL family, sensor histidine kinase UhpB